MFSGGFSNIVFSLGERLMSEKGGENFDEAIDNLATLETGENYD